MKTFTRLLSPIIFSMTALLPFQSHANSDGYYFGGYGGIGYTKNTTVESALFSLGVDFDSPTASAGGQFGIKYGALRGEIQFSYLRVPVENENEQRMFLGSLLKTSTSGNLQTFGIFANGFYDFDTGTQFQPYLGAGIGGAKSNGEVKSQTTYDGLTNIDIYETSDLVLAGQLIGGVTINISDNVDAFVDYRFIVQNGILSEHLQNHTFNVGLNIKLSENTN